MISCNITILELRRLRALQLLLPAGLAILAIMLWRIQIGHGQYYETNLERQSIRRVRLPGTRGHIYDRNGLCLADNLPRYGIAIYLEELRQNGKRRNLTRAAMATVREISAITGMQPQLTEAMIAEHIGNRKALPLTAWREADERALARLAEASHNLPGADVTTDAERFYPLGNTAAHIIGYVGRAENTDDAERPYHYYLPDMAGKTGLEKQFDHLLAGSAGGHLVQVDVAGFKHHATALREPVPGGDLHLTIDARIQRAAENVMADTVGAVVVLDPQQGDVLALASAPGFDPNIFHPTLSAADWSELRDNPHKPLFNRAITGLYPPASTFKPLVAMAALTQKRITPDFTTICEGFIELGGRRFACYHGEAHGTVSLQRALRVSCNVFFYQTGLLCGREGLYHMALALGFGQPTGIELPGENAGLLPDQAWKHRRTGEGWRDGDTCNMSVGQGALLVTPLQMAIFTAALANGGKLFKPRLIRAIRKTSQTDLLENQPIMVRDLRWDPANLDLIHAGMRDVIEHHEGTGRAARIPGILMAGKTGTAEYGQKQAGRNHGWMILFAPFENPRYAVAMVMDDALSGGISLAPRMRQLMLEIFEMEGTL